MIIYFKNVFCLCVCLFNMPSACGTEEGVRSARIGVTDDCEPQCRAVNWAQVLWRTVSALKQSSWLFFHFWDRISISFPILLECMLWHMQEDLTFTILFSQPSRSAAVYSLCYQAQLRFLMNEVFTLACPYNLVSALESFGPRSCVTLAVLDPNYSMTSPLPWNQCCFHIPNRCKVGRDLRQSSQADFNFRNCFFVFSITLTVDDDH